MTTHDVIDAPGPVPQATSWPEPGIAAGSPTDLLKAARKAVDRNA